MTHIKLASNPTFLFLCFYVLTAIWIYYDATKHNIGKLSDREEKKLILSSANDGFSQERRNDRLTLNLTAGMWAFGTMLAGVVGSLFISIALDNFTGLMGSFTGKSLGGILDHVCDSTDIPVESPIPYKTRGNNSCYDRYVSTNSIAGTILRNGWFPHIRVCQYPLTEASIR